MKTEQKQNVLQGICASGITELKTIFVTALKAEPPCHRHILNTTVS